MKAHGGRIEETSLSLSERSDQKVSVRYLIVCVLAGLNYTLLNEMSKSVKDIISSFLVGISHVLSGAQDVIDSD